MAVAYFPTSCMCFLAIGGLLAYFDLYRPEVFKKIAQPLVAYTGILICVLLLFWIRYADSIKVKEMFDDFLIAVLSLFIVARASINGFQFLPKWVLENKFVVYSGKISYGLYVYHMFAPPLYYYLTPKIGLTVNNRFTECVICFFITFVVAHFSWIIVEKPINSFKRKFPYEKKAVSVV
jgi:peptidoglycan/LPS O-acetylase OafA/YrhL